MTVDRILYLATGVFDKGGIARYSRYQIQALREILGPERVDVLSLLPPPADALETPFLIGYAGRGVGRASKARYVLEAVRQRMLQRPHVVWSNHVNLLPLSLALGVMPPASRTVVNVYAIELWSERQALHNVTLPQTDLVISDCHFTAEYAVRCYDIDRRKLEIIWDCVDIRRFKPGPRRYDILRRFGVPIGDEYRYIMTLGRIDRPSRYKGYDRLIDAMAALRDTTFITLFAGDGDDRQRLEQRVRDEGLDNHVYFLGSIHEDDLVDVYNLCHVFTLVSERGVGQGEGVPLTPLEAAACGKPIIVGDEDGSREAVRDRVSGLVISPRDRSALPAALARVLSSDEERRLMGEAGRDKIAAEFSYEKFRAKTEHALELVGI